VIIPVGILHMHRSDKAESATDEAESATDEAESATDEAESATDEAESATDEAESATDEAVVKYGCATRRMVGTNNKQRGVVRRVAWNSPREGPSPWRQTAQTRNRMLVASRS
jgi:hypothetical protein